MNSHYFSMQATTLKVRKAADSFANVYFEWIIPNFSKLEQDYYDSFPFSTSDSQQWFLRVYPVQTLTYICILLFFQRWNNRS